MTPSAYIGRRNGKGGQSGKSLRNPIQVAMEIGIIHSIPNGALHPSINQSTNNETRLLRESFGGL